MSKFLCRLFWTAIFSARLCLATCAEQPPNIVYILADDLGYGDVSCLNEQCAWTTPNIDRLATEGIRFTDAHSGSAVCTPTRYGILTGRYAWRSRLKRGVLHGDSPHLIDPKRMTVASLLKRHSYHTGVIGKWHLGWDFSKQADHPGQIDFSAPVGNGPGVVGFDDSYCHNGSLDMAPYVYVENGRVTAAPDRTTENEDYQAFWRKGLTGADFHHADVLPNFTRHAVEFIHTQAADQGPFFLYLPLPAPHTPILPSPKFLGKSHTNLYGDFVLQVDDTVGQVLQALEEMGCSENTLVIFASDNGCSPRAGFEELAKFGHHPSYTFRGHKADIFEGGHRIPFLVRWPGKVKPGRRSDETLCLTDFLRTCAELLEDPLPDNAGEDSVSFLPLLLGGNQDSPLREATIHHSVNGSFAIRQGKWKLLLCPGSGGWSAPRPKVARAQGLPPLQLYDLVTDIGERQNVAAAHPEVVARLVRLAKHYVEQGRSTPGTPQTNEGDTPFLPQGVTW